MAARNMYRIEINIHEKLCVKSVIYKDHKCLFCMITGFHHEVDENCALLGYYAASSGNFYQCFGIMYCPHLQGSRIKILGP
jgi:hypothetical protein